jgi:hypothetical protein
MVWWGVMPKSNWTPIVADADIARHVAVAVGNTFVFAALALIVVRLLVMDL